MAALIKHFVGRYETFYMLIKAALSSTFKDMRHSTKQLRLH